MSEPLAEVVRRAADRPVPAFITPLMEAVLARFPRSVYAALFYGSCRRNDSADGVIDLYVVLDDRSDLRGVNRWLSSVLPPSVYYLEVATPAGETLRCKCSTILRGAFFNGMSRRWLLTYLTARFTQPASLIYARDHAARQAVLAALTLAPQVFLERVAPALPGAHRAADFWFEAFRLSYRTEMRSESEARIRELYTLEQAHLDAVLAALSSPAAAGQQLPLERIERAEGVLFRCRASAADQSRQRWLWRARIGYGKVLSCARILKSAYTFDGGIDYVAWKLSRHSGQAIEVPEAVRRRPWLHVWGFLWGLYRRGVFR